MQKLFLTFFYMGLLRPAPGTWGSLGGAVTGYFIYHYVGDQTLFLASFALFLFSINIINDYERKIGAHDPSEIVIDEVAGVWLAISVSGGSLLATALSFAFFRLLDITKPSIIGKIDRDVKGGLGVMGDDMVAGAFAGIFSAIVCNLLAHSNLKYLLEF